MGLTDIHHDPRANRPLVLIWATDGMLAKALAITPDIILLRPSDKWTSYALARAKVCLTFNNQQHEAESLVDLYLRQASPLAIISLTEACLMTAAKMEQALGIARNALDVVYNLKDKAAMREKLTAAGGDDLNIQARPVACSADVIRFARELSFKSIIVKPRTGTSSESVHRFTGETDITVASTQLDYTQYDYVAEEYVQGQEYSVEAISQHGRHHILAITEKQTNTRFVEVGHCIPPRSLTSTQAALIYAAVTRFLSLLGLHHGPSHTEIMLSGDSIKIIESHNRIGGDRINELVRLATGHDMTSLVFEAVYQTLDLPEKPMYRAGAAIRFLTPQPGRVTAIDTSALEQQRYEIHLFIQPGDHVKDIRSSSDRAGYVLADGPTSDEAFRRAETGATRIKIYTEPVIVPQGS